MKQKSKPEYRCMYEYERIRPKQYESKFTCEYPFQCKYMYEYTYRSIRMSKRTLAHTVLVHVNVQVDVHALRHGCTYTAAAPCGARRLPHRSAEPALPLPQFSSPAFGPRCGHV